MVVRRLTTFYHTLSQQKKKNHQGYRRFKRHEYKVDLITYIQRCPWQHTSFLANTDKGMKQTSTDLRNQGSQRTCSRITARLSWQMSTGRLWRYGGFGPSQPAGFTAIQRVT